MRPSTHREGWGRAARGAAGCGRGPRQTIIRLARVCLALGALTLLAACSVSERDEREIGSSEAASIDSQVPMVHDTAITQFVTRLGQSLTSNTGRTDVEWRFTVVNVWPVNAFALPGGYVYVTRGLIEQSDRLDELAGVMGHEVAHVVRRHTAKQIQEGHKQDVGVVLLCTLTGLCGTLGGAIAVRVGAEAQTAQYSQQHEAEADSVGVIITRRAGIDPQGLPLFLEKVLAQRKEQPTALEAFFASHPTDESRIAALRSEIAALGPSTGASLIRDTPEFQALRERVRALPLPPPPYDTLGAPTRPQ
jgi:predicted Zn-dependent protease